MTISEHYLKRYIALIDIFMGQTYDDRIYYEKHHVVPKCLGGEDCRDNIVRLTARQHFIAHYVLSKAVPCKETRFAVFSMSMNGSGKRLLKSREIEIARQVVSKLSKERVRNEEWCDNISKSLKGKKKSKEHNERNRLAHLGQIPWNKGLKNHCSPETIEKLRKSHLGQTPWNKGLSYKSNSKEKLFHFLHTSGAEESIKSSSFNKKDNCFNKLGIGINRTRALIKNPGLKSNGWIYQFVELIDRTEEN